MSSFSPSQVAKHNTESDCWIIINNQVYDVTAFLAIHPGGKKVLLRWAGKDATTEFEALHAASVLTKYSNLKIGVLADTEPRAPRPVPHGEPLWHNPKFLSPYYTEKHRAWQKKVRAFVDAELLPNVSQWDAKGDYPDSFVQKMIQHGLYAPSYPAEWGGTRVEGWDMFMMMILDDEFARAACGGAMASSRVFNIGLPPIFKHGSLEMKQRVVPDVLQGRKNICLCITEPYGGSDVASVRTTAVRDGDFYIVNGEKKFITGALKADYFTVAVRTGGPGMQGISLLLLEKGMSGINIRRQNTQGWLSSNTGYITMEDVRVPVSNLIGQENRGFLYVMYNFNGERFFMSVSCARYSRVCLEEAVRFARKRITFGKPLIKHQVVRHKIADMARRIESVQTMLELICYNLDRGCPDDVIGGTVALTKVEATQCYEYCAREASQILGGNSFLRSGIGERVERLYREVRVNAIGGGSEEIMKELSMNFSKL